MSGLSIANGIHREFGDILNAHGAARVAKYVERIASDAARAAERALVKRVEAVLRAHELGAEWNLSTDIAGNRLLAMVSVAAVRAALRPEAATTEGAADDQTCCAMAEVVCARCSNCPVHCLCRQPCTKCPPGEHSDLRHGGLVDPLAARPDTGEGAE
jgi:hypothetical protein